MLKKFLKMSLIFVLCLMVVLQITKSYAKYVIQNEFDVANVNIDRTPPKIELLNIQNSDVEYGNYVNKTHTVIAKIKILDKNLYELLADSQHFKIKVGEIFVDNVGVEFGEVIDKSDGKIIDIAISNLEFDGKLQLFFDEGFAVDAGGLKSEKMIVSTDIVIDNNIPIVQGESDEISIDKF